MDSIKNLPINTNNQEMNDDEKYVMGKYFKQQTVENEDIIENTGLVTKVVYLCILYILISNPFTEKLCSIVPYVGASKITILLLRVVIFGIISFIILNYM